MVLLDGIRLRNELLDNYKQIIIQEDLKITLAIIQIGNNESSNTYIKNKIKYTEKVGIKTNLIKLPETITEEEVLKIINELNEDKEITGIIIQSPVPNHLNFKNLARKISNTKDVDGLSKDHILDIIDNKETILPCTVKGILTLFDYYNIELEGKNIVVIGRSDIVGKPLSESLVNKNATVTICHSKTKDLEVYTKKADIIISAVGKPNLINKEMVKENFIGIDVGINIIEGKIVGDFNENVKEKSSYLTPVPGGVGPMTIAMLVYNLIKLKKGQ
jgi:methylenetetrahydrofolate dehydrogenase (NADP+)/methenyltetrahydrofolate cyclohydrolase